MLIESLTLLVAATLVGAVPSPNGDLSPPPPKLTCIDNSLFRGDIFLSFPREEPDQYIDDFCSGGFTLNPEGGEQGKDAYAGFRAVAVEQFMIMVHLSDCNGHKAESSEVSEMFCRLQLAYVLDNCDKKEASKFGGQYSVPVSFEFANGLLHFEFRGRMFADWFWADLQHWVLDIFDL